MWVTVQELQHELGIPFDRLRVEQWDLLGRCGIIGVCVRCNDSLPVEILPDQLDGHAGVEEDRGVEDARLTLFHAVGDNLIGGRVALCDIRVCEVESVVGLHVRDRAGDGGDGCLDLRELGLRLSQLVLQIFHFLIVNQWTILSFKGANS